MPQPAPRTLVVRRHRLTAMGIQEATCLDGVSTTMLHRIRAHPGLAEPKPEHLNRKRQDRLCNDPSWRGQTELLRRVPGGGSVVAWVHIAELPEPEHLKDQMAATPVGRRP